MEISVIIPTLDEQDNIGHLLGDLSDIATVNLKLNAIVVDDGSRDDTINIVKSRMAESDNQFFSVNLYQRVDEKGLGSAILAGIRRSKTDYVIVMDADMSHSPCMVEIMSRRLEDGYDIVIGSRYTRGGKTSGWPLRRKLISRIATMIATVGLKIKQKDPLSGYFAMRKTILEGIDLDALGYKILMEILAKRRDLKIAEEPIQFRDRASGSSKMTTSTIWAFIVSVYRLYMHGRKEKKARTSARFLSKTARFFTVGASGLAVNVAVASLLTSFASVWFIHGNLAGIAASISSNFILNKIWTFEDHDLTYRIILLQYGKFALFGSAGAALQVTMVYYLAELGNVSHNTALIIAVLIAAFGNFVLNKRFTFNEKIWS